MLNFFPFETKYYYKLDIEQEQGVQKLGEKLDYLHNYKGSVNSWGFIFERKPPLTYRNSFVTNVNGAFIKNQSELYFVLTFYFPDSIKFFSILGVIVSIIFSLVGTFQHHSELTPLFLYYILAFSFIKVFNYFNDESGVIQIVESALNYPLRIKKTSFDQIYKTNCM